MIALVVGHAGLDAERMNTSVKEDPPVSAAITETRRKVGQGRLHRRHLGRVKRWYVMHILTTTIPVKH